jgi:hypothetical protein
LRRTWYTPGWAIKALVGGRWPAAIASRSAVKGQLGHQTRRLHAQSQAT